MCRALKNKATVEKASYVQFGHILVNIFLINPAIIIWWSTFIKYLLANIWNYQQIWENSLQISELAGIPKSSIPGFLQDWSIKQTYHFITILPLLIYHKVVKVYIIVLISSYLLTIGRAYPLSTLWKIQSGLRHGIFHFCAYLYFEPGKRRKMTVYT